MVTWGCNPVARYRGTSGARTRPFCARFEVNASATDASPFGVQRGFNDVELGLRLRYEITREFAPYVGVSWVRRLGDTADLARARGEKETDTALAVGLRFWF